MSRRSAYTDQDQKSSTKAFYGMFPSTCKVRVQSSTRRGVPPNCYAHKFVCLSELSGGRISGIGGGGGAALALAEASRVISNSIDMTMNTKKPLRATEEYNQFTGNMLEIGAH